MNAIPRTRLWRSALAASAALAVTAGIVAAAPEDRAQAAPAGPKLSLLSAVPQITWTSYPANEWYPGGIGEADLGLHLAAEGSPFELRLKRTSYDKPIAIEQIVHEGKKKRVKKLPAGLTKDFRGLPGFIEVTLTDAAGKTVLKQGQNFCPNNASGRLRPGGPQSSRFPQGCPDNPLTVGSVWGVEKDWGTNTYSGHYEDKPLQLAAGNYTAKAVVAKKYRDLFGIPAKTQTVKVKVEEYVPDPEEGGPVGRAAGAGAHAHHAAGHGGHSGHGQAPKMSLAQATGGTGPSYNVGHTPYPPAPPALAWALRNSARSAANVGDRAGQHDGSRKSLGDKPNAQRPTGRAKVPNVPKPDLRSLPAFGVTIQQGAEMGQPGKDFVTFAANVWNAGPAELVVDGFRAKGKDVMDAYQYFHDTNGKQVGFTPAGSMEWDPREGHNHWHFVDFANYSLLKADKKQAVRSGKEAFCLANTDAVDYTVKGANWSPDNTDLTSACSGPTRVSIRQRLDVGSGDTYTQDLPDQAFDITGLANGTYWIEVKANPANRLKETSTKNNTALRKIVLGGVPGARTVKVPPIGLIDDHKPRG
ncbi:lysyl oxidase family protein [Streptomyces yaizuensis]|uniref:Protein-lysine 6-oxidase n=1 Tax=Streptomyces yaizuensis TaxID=2989713 RepID=A0ABQ5P2V5_9ACTN|nr:lysyl oxidase family protein [Streptomyces sp. YSPA8]GLF96910.1 protein-lysine 6-oxidase [Streptomyces sp. YSPA8]